MKNIVPSVFLFSALLLFFTSLVPCDGLCAGNRVYLDIQKQETRKLVFAVPWFINSARPEIVQQKGREESDILSRSLAFHNIIEVLPVEKYGGQTKADWKKLGVDYVVLGTYTITPKKTIYKLHLLDVAGGRNLLGIEYTGSKRDIDKILFKFTDRVIKALTGERGIAYSQIAFVSDASGAKEVYLTDILGKKTRKVTRHRSLVVSPRFSPDGRFLAYTSYHTGNQNLYVTDLSQNKTTISVSRRLGMNLAPAWSPDGRKMIVTLSKDGNPDLYMLNRQGKILKRLTRNQGINVSPTWSPDGKKIAFVSDRSRKPQLYIMDLARGTTQRIRLKQGSENAEPVWSPQGDLIAYSSLRGKYYQICVVNPAQGNNAVQLTHGNVNHESPAWSPDGRQIIYSQRDKRRQMIYIIDKNGKNQRRLFDLPGNQTYPRWSVKPN